MMYVQYNTIAAILKLFLITPQMIGKSVAKYLVTVTPIFKKGDRLQHDYCNHHLISIHLTYSLPLAFHFVPYKLCTKPYGALYGIKALKAES